MRIVFCIILNLATVSFLAQGWVNLTPIKTNSDIKACSFINELQGLAVTATDGLILETSDGGITWREPWAPTVSSNLYGVAYVTEDTAFVCGNTGGLFRTVDGGNSWIDMNPPTNEWLYQLCFVNSTLGFACGFNGVILRTTDGGDSWTVIPSGTTNRLWDIQFLNDTLGFAAGWNGTVLKTIDAGITWGTLNTGTTTSYQSVSFINDQVGWVCGSSGTVLKTTNGGESWTSQITGGLNTLYHVNFRSATHGWAVGGLGTYYSTTNGGSTWNTASSLGSSDLYCGAYLSTNTSFVMGTRQIYKSTNNGSSWTLVKNGVPRSNNHDLYFSNDNTGTVVGAVGGVGSGSNQAGIVQTSNGGQTWDIRQQGSSGGWYAVHFPTTNVGYVASNTNLGKTINGGSTWTYSTFDNSVASVWFTTPDIGFIGANYGFSGLCTTVNGGSSFTCAGNMPTRDIFFLNDQWGIAIPGVGGTIQYRTIDGGLNWSIEAGIGGNCIFFLDENTGYIGSTGTLHKTIDGGLTWSSQYVGGGGDILAVKFFTPEIGFFVTSYNQVYKSVDAGENWELIQDYYVTMSSAISGFFTDNYCYTGGAAGDVYRCELGCGDFTAGNIIGDNEWCENHIGILAVPQVPGATSYQWTLPDGWTGATNSAVIEPIASDQSGLATVTITNACGLQSSTSYDITVTHLVESIVAIDGPTSICADGTYEYTVIQDPWATNYDWQVTSGFIASENGNSLTINSASANGMVIVQSSNECGVSGYTTLNVMIAPTTPVNLILTPDTACTGDLVMLSGGLPSGGIFSGENVVNGQIDLTDIPESDVIIEYTYAAPGACAGSASDTLHVITFLDLPGNLNGDCTIDQSDLDLLLGLFGCLNNCGNADINDDGIVGIDDVILLIGTYGL